MNISFKHFFNACQPEFKSLHGVSWEAKPELYYQYLQTRYLAMIAENLASGSSATEGLEIGMGGIRTSVPIFAAEHEKENRPVANQEKEHIET